MYIKFWVDAARVHTLPIALSGILLSALIAYSRDHYDVGIFFMSCITSLLLQILANFSNDYGDAVKGTDSFFRMGPPRVISSGYISRECMKKAIGFITIVYLISSTILIWISFKNYKGIAPIFFIIGIFTCLYASIKYTVGKNAYGYKGMGDVSVFLFFGLTSVLGSYFLYTHRVEWDIFLLAISIGLLSTSVLNLNNMRDINGDRQNGKYTFVVKIGLQIAKLYHIFLVLTPFVLGSFFVMLNKQTQFYRWAFLILLFPIFFNIKKVFSRTNFDKEIKNMAIITFLYALFMGLGQV
ncbi:1,4-dihydroxy-2-naphthoate octaprenyltransferase [Candidatus Walczuchella monophlebidarum]|uniref:1,4-dihydroxy-2-naphthoate octaprenyltransferase n=1 Tax=Candidatus Walczuchella monophlebidarum TaxID=1415657 RepID=A0A068DST1_9FLAO|nr:1,4-dihydroxy-2-naphthoate octaprenyltransferase [Candidatus Walczuchella monophlebidarum]AID37454.1 1,4-dihydroxy-2-naphthoate octaprenyltransferase [Candidatus Walczuchella monophlebidarum]